MYHPVEAKQHMHNFTVTKNFYKFLLLFNHPIFPSYTRLGQTSQKQDFGELFEQAMIN